MSHYNVRILTFGYLLFLSTCCCFYQLFAELEIAGRVATVIDACASDDDDAGDDASSNSCRAGLSRSLSRTAAARSPWSALFEDLPALDELERRYLLYILEVAGGNRTRAAETLGIDRRTLYRMIDRYGIDAHAE